MDQDYYPDTDCESSDETNDESSDESNNQTTVLDILTNKPYTRSQANKKRKHGATIQSKPKRKHGATIQSKPKRRKTNSKLKNSSCSDKSKQESSRNIKLKKSDKSKLKKSSCSESDDSIDKDFKLDDSYDKDFRLDDSYNTDDEDDVDNDMSPVLQPGPGFLQILLKRAAQSDEDAKEETVNEWLEDVKAGKRRKLRKTAEKIYDKITALPKHSDIIQSKMPFKEKCLLIEQMEILDNCPRGTRAYYKIKKEIFKTITSYERMKENASELENIHSKEDQLIPEDESDPLKFKILKANLSDSNKIVVLDKYNAYTHMEPWNEERNKLYVWIQWALSIVETTIPMRMSSDDGSLNINRYLYSIKEYMNRYLFGMDHIKDNLLELVAARITNPNAKDLSIGLLGSPGVGKCLHPDTEVLLFFGGIKRAKDIVKGDILIGDNGMPRIVMSTTNGIDTMYKIKLENGESFIVNEPHVLTLYNDVKGVYDIPLNEYITANAINKGVVEKGIYRRDSNVVNNNNANNNNANYMFSVPVEYTKQEIKNDPFLIGIVLAKNKKSNITTANKISARLDKAYTVEKALKLYLSKKLDYIETCIENTNLVPINSTTVDSDELKQVIHHGYIPNSYLYNTREVRHRLLKGLYENSKQPRRSRSVKRTTSRRKPVNYKILNSKKVKFTNNTPKVKFADNKVISRRKSLLPVRRPSLKRSKSLPSKKAFTSDEVIKAVKLIKDRTPTNKGLMSSSKGLTPTNKEVIIHASNRILGDQLKFLVNSLGYKYTYKFPLITIHDNINELPPINTKNKLSFEIEKLDTGNYCGFTLDSNGRFLLANCVVSHNTHLVQVFSKAVELPYSKINMGGSTDVHHFLGHSYTYIGAQPGVLVKAIRQMKSKSGIIYFDEFDKIETSNWGGANKVSHAFLHISDPIQNEEFQDEYLSEIKIDLSNYMFIYSFNDEKNINPVLKNRIPIYKVNGYNRKEKMQICKNYIIPEIYRNIGINTSDLIFSDEAIYYAVDTTASADKDGIRTVKHLLWDLIKKINLIKTCHHPEGLLKLNYAFKQIPTPYIVRVEDFEHFKVGTRTDLDDIWLGSYL